MNMDPRAMNVSAPRKALRCVVLTLLSVAVLAPSCGVFDTRDPEPPSDGGSETPWEQPVNPNAVLFNFVNAILYLDQGNYEQIQAEDFWFVPDPVDVEYFLSTVGVNVFEDWGRDEELTAVRLIFTDSESLEVAIVEDSREEDTQQALIRLYYTFRRRLAPEVAADPVATFKGFAEIHMRADNQGFWSIDSWEDTEVETEFNTWGRLKGSTAS